MTQTTMEDPILGTYQCVDDDCQTSFKVTSTVIVDAYEDWEPICPVCGTRNEIQQVDAPKRGVRDV